MSNAPPAPDTRALVCRCNEALGNVAPSTPQIGPEHIEALIVGVTALFDNAAEWETAADTSENPNFRAACWANALAAVQRAARLAEIRAYLESL